MYTVLFEQKMHSSEIWVRHTVGLLIMLMSGQNCCVRDRDDSGTVICPGSVVTWTLVRYRVVTWTLDKVASRAVLRPGKGCVRDSVATWKGLSPGPGCDLERDVSGTGV